MNETEALLAKQNDLLSELIGAVKRGNALNEAIYNEVKYFAEEAKRGKAQLDRLRGVGRGV